MFPCCASIRLSKALAEDDSRCRPFPSNRCVVLLYRSESGVRLRCTVIARATADALCCERWDCVETVNRLPTRYHLVFQVPARGNCGRSPRDQPRLDMVEPGSLLMREESRIAGGLVKGGWSLNSGDLRLRGGKKGRLIRRPSYRWFCW